VFWCVLQPAELIINFVKYHYVKPWPYETCSPKTGPEKNQALETLEESSIPEQKEEPVLAEIDLEIECPRCNEIMELCFATFEGVSILCFCGP
jgi:hypothetical protein